MGDGTKSESATALAKASQHGIPWAAVVVAALGWYDARATSNEAVRDAASAVTVAEVATVDATRIGDARLRNAYQAMELVVEANAERIDDLEGWVVELEDWLEEHIEEDSPRNGMERAGREERLAAIRRAKSTRADSPPPAAKTLPDFDKVQKQSPLR